MELCHLKPWNTFQKLEEASKDPPPKVSESAWSNQPLFSDCWSSELMREYIYVISSHPIFGTFLHHNWETKILVPLLDSHMIERVVNM